MDELIRGEYHDDGIRVSSGDETYTESDGGCGVSLGGLGKDVFLGELCGNFPYGLLLQAVSEDEDVFLRDESLKPVDGLVEQGGFPKEIE